MCIPKLSASFHAMCLYRNQIKPTESQCGSHRFQTCSSLEISCSLLNLVPMQLLAAASYTDNVPVWLHDPKIPGFSLNE